MHFLLCVSRIKIHRQPGNEELQMNTATGATHNVSLQILDMQWDEIMLICADMLSGCQTTKYALQRIIQEPEQELSYQRYAVVENDTLVGGLVGGLVSPKLF
ncbi:uncharacterized protein LOC124668300 isoform X3 [Lolium rigidum]|uniref:uncharacterized protein LOC124668300 isoform X3 n=1 Tax=Lolium rigidum TaxID=89674 RepID=UPI001F5CABE4|nr:uncharacterized protein LOC124668300 isoform X3 [Lolium rigidum]